MQRSLLPLVLALTMAGPAPSIRGAEQAAACEGRRATIVGTSGKDVLRGTRKRDVIVGGGGADVIRGGGGPDRICGGSGRDELEGGRGSDRLLGERGDDEIDGDAGGDRIEGGRGDDICFQGADAGTSRGCVPVIAAAGDIACAPTDHGFNGGAGTADRCHMQATASLLTRTDHAAVLALGDLQYERGAYADFLASYDPSWGRDKAETRPVPGNHEYGTAGAAGYFDYFGAAAGTRGQGWYSFDLPGWHLVALNSSDGCGTVGCGPGSAQHTWLVRDLASSTASCTLAYWHHPRWASEVQHRGTPAVGPFWEALAADGGDVVLGGHAHVYERFAPQDPAGRASPAGISQFTVGTGGKDLRGFGAVAPNSEVRLSRFGVLEMALAGGRFAWRFMAEDGSVMDRGSADCS